MDEPSQGEINGDSVSQEVSSHLADEPGGGETQDFYMGTPVSDRSRVSDRRQASKRRNDGPAENDEDFDEKVRRTGQDLDMDSPISERTPAVKRRSDALDMDNEMSSMDIVDRKIIAAAILGVDITEVYSPERVAQVAKRYGLTAGTSMDLTTGWDFNRADHREGAWKQIKKESPYLLIGSPPCTYFSMLQELNIAVNGNKPGWMERFHIEKEKAKKHVEFCCSLYKYQLDQGRHFLHEHPWSARSWGLPCIEKILSHPSVELAQGHMCRFLMTSHVEHRGGEVGLVKKPTGFMCSSSCIIQELDRKCTGDHSHVPLVGGRAAGAQVYPQALCEAICRGVAKQKEKDQSTVTTGRMTAVGMKQLVGHLCSLQCVGSIKLPQILSTKVVDGHTRPTGDYPAHWVDDWHEPDGGQDDRGTRPQHGVTLLQAEMSGLTYRGGYEAAWDDVSNAELVPALVKAARAVEMEYFERLGVYERVPRSHQVTTGGKVIGVRWVDVNKGDATDTNYRSRLVGREFNVGRDDALYAATPPLEALRLVISHAATYPDHGPRRMVMVNDVRRAYFYAKIKRDVYIELPAEDDKHGTGMLGKLKLCLYGTRDAAKGWQETLSSHLESIGFARGKGHPCVFWHAEKGIKTLVHGDDYVSAGSAESMAWLEAKLSEAYEIQTQKLGLGVDCQLEGKVLNRILRCNDDGWEIEADPRHAELVIEQLGLNDDKGIGTPGVSGADEEDNDDDYALTGEDITRYRGVIARCNYLGSDRPDCLFAIKEGCREMSAPTTGSLRRLRRIGRYLKTHPRLVWKYRLQGEQLELTVKTDADWAGCRRARKSTSGGCISIGDHCIKAWSKTQNVIAKSSAESELYGVVKGACEALGLKTLCADMGSDVGVRLELDATAAKGILDRQGMAKVRHIDVNCLWLQEQCAKKIVPLNKIPGEENGADLMTKHLAAAVIDKHIKQLNLEFREGRAAKAAKLHSLETRRRSGLRKAERLKKVEEKEVKAFSHLGKLSGMDYWSERGELGRWVRVHVTPRLTKFLPMDAPEDGGRNKGPGRKTRLMASRLSQGTCNDGTRFREDDDWTTSKGCSSMRPWTGKTVFIVNRKHDADFGTDQRRQRVDVINRSISWADEE